MKLELYYVKKIVETIKEKGPITFKALMAEGIVFEMSEEDLRRLLIWFSFLIEETSFDTYKWVRYFDDLDEYLETEWNGEEWGFYDNKTIDAIILEKEHSFNSIQQGIIDFMTKNAGSKYSTKDIIGYLEKIIKDTKELNFFRTKSEEYFKSLLDKFHYEGKLGRDGNHRYFVEEEKKDVKAELNKFKDLLDSGLISQEDYDNKKNELLGL
tara:strand:- start:345 stop:977 length:633 start_codon:yes stop_codon:yes gene_type:complete